MFDNWKPLTVNDVSCFCWRGGRGSAMSLVNYSYLPRLIASSGCQTASFKPTPPLCPPPWLPLPLLMAIVIQTLVFMSFDNSKWMWCALLIAAVWGVRIDAARWVALSARFPLVQRTHRVQCPPFELMTRWRIEWRRQRSTGVTSHGLSGSAFLSVVL